MRKPGIKTVQVRFSPELKKQFVRLCQRIADEIERERQMGIGPMATYAACYLLTLSDEEATRVVLRGKAYADKHPLPKDEPEQAPLIDPSANVKLPATILSKNPGKSQRGRPKGLDGNSKTGGKSRRVPRRK